MNDAPNLTLAFLQSRPDAAARVIEELDPADAAALLQTVPVRLAAPVVNHMPAWAAAHLLAQLPDDHGAGILRQMVYQDATSVLRLLEPERLKVLLDALPSRLARDFRQSLDYPLRVVGAWMERAIPTFRLDSTVADGMKYLRQRSAINLSHLFVVDANRRLAGTVEVAQILRAPSSTPLQQLLEREVRAISNRAFLASVADIDDWDHYLALPVVGRRDNVLGGLTRQALRRGLEMQEGTGLSLSPDSLLMQLFAGYFVAFAGLLRVTSRRGQSAPSSKT